MRMIFFILLGIMMSRLVLNLEMGPEVALVVFIILFILYIFFVKDS